jgi:hypothetical protein
LRAHPHLDGRFDLFFCHHRFGQVDLNEMHRV